MSVDRSLPPELRRQLDDVIAEYLDAVHDGDKPDREPLLARYPELANHLRTFFAAQDAKKPPGDSAAADSTVAALPSTRTSPHSSAAIDSTTETVAPGAYDTTWLVPQGGTQPGGTKASGLGDYELLQEIARGGMGVVYKARQISLNRIVALKMILAGQLASDDEVRRFYTEAEAAAHLDHPGIVPIYEVGQHEGQPYFSMGFVEGQSVAAKLAAGPLAPREAAELVLKVAQAIAYAHERGVIHRDLKPGNILLDQRGEPRVTDFGLAKRLEHVGNVPNADLTATGQILGTPNYMPPEQASGQADQVGPLADVYALGAVLYALLTGGPPFRAATVMETLRAVLDEEPVPPRQRRPRVPLDLNTVCLKCLEKERSRRYVSARELAEELQRYLNGEPILARPVTRFERAVRWAVRRPAMAASWILLVLTVVLGTSGGVAFWQWRRAEAARSDAEDQRGIAEDLAKAEKKQRQRADGLLHVNRVSLADRELDVGNHGSAADVLDECRWNERDWEWLYVRRRNPLRLKLKGHARSATSVSFSPDGRRLASGSSDGTIKIWDLQRSGAPVELGGHGLTAGAVKFSPQSTTGVSSVTFSPDGQRLASGGRDNTVKIWDLEKGGDPITLKGHTLPVFSVSFSPDGQRLASGSEDTTVRIWDLAQGGKRLTLRGHTSYVHSVSFSPDGRRLASASHDNTIKLWDVERRGEPITLKGHTEAVSGVGFSPDGRRLASASWDHTVKLWDLQRGAELRTLSGHTSSVYDVNFSPDGRRLASASGDKTVKVWDLQRPGEPLTLRGHTSGVLSVRFSPDARRLASLGGDNSVQLWDLQRDGEPLTLKGHTKGVASVSFSPDGRRLASGSEDQNVKLWNLQRGGEPLTLKGHKNSVLCVSFSPDGRWLASAGGDSSVKLWDLQRGGEPVTLQGHTGSVRSLSFSPDGQRLASGSYDNTVKLWDVQTGRVLLTLKKGPPSGVVSVCFSPDGRQLASIDRTVNIWDLEQSDRARDSLPTVTAQPTTLERLRSGTSVCFSPDWRQMASATNDHCVTVWDIQRGGELFVLRGQVGGVGFSPDGRRLVTGSRDNSVRLWDPETGAELCTLKGHSDLVRSVSFSPDGRRLATGSADGTVRLWDARLGVEYLTLSGDSQFRSVGFGSDGQQIAAGDDQAIKAWRVDTGERVTPDRDTAYAEDTRVRQATSADGKLSVWINGDELLARRLDDVERQDREEATLALEWHLRMTAEAEAATDWFAARFHLSELLKTLAATKDDGLDEADLLRRHTQAEAALKSAASSSPSSPND